jgi:hypothetical protein
MLPDKAKWRWARNAALVAFLISLSDLLEWRGNVFHPWTSAETVAHNLAVLAGSAGLAALIGLFLGSLWDLRAGKA